LFGKVTQSTTKSPFLATLPWLVLADARIDSDGKLRFQLSREDIPVTKTKIL
jgi:hypothetical protein